MPVWTFIFPYVCLFVCLPSCTLKLSVCLCLHYRGLCCSWRCLHTGAWAAYGCVCTEVCAAPGDVYTTGAWTASERVCSTEACAAPEGVYTIGAELHLKCLHYRGLCCSWRCLCTPHGPELHLDVSAPQRYVLLDVSNPQGPVLTYCQTCLLRFENNFLSI